MAGPIIRVAHYRLTGREIRPERQPRPVHPPAHSAGTVQTQLNCTRGATCKEVRSERNPKLRGRISSPTASRSR